MSDVPAVPEHHGPLVPSLTCSPCDEAIDWYVRVFGAEEFGDRMVGPDGKVAHAELVINGQMVMLGDEWHEGPIVSPTTLGGSAGALFLYAENARELFDRAVAEGAEVVFPYELQFYGHEGGRIRDPFGHMWGLGKQVEIVSDEDMQERMAAFMQAQA